MGRNGFTLVELLIAGAIFITVVAVMCGLYVTGLDISATARCQAELQARSRAALSEIVNELMCATRTSAENPSPNAFIPAKPGNTSIGFYLPNRDQGGDIIVDSQGRISWNSDSPVDEIKYEYVPSHGALRRTWMDNDNQKARVLASDVSAAEFEDITIDNTLAINEVRVTLSLTKATRSGRRIMVTRKALVVLRN